MLRIVITGCLILCLFGCDYIKKMSNQVDTSKIFACPSASNAGIKWGTNSNSPTGQIDTVKFECIKNETSGANDKASSTQEVYDIALTANISYDASKAIYTPLYGTIIFEAKSNQGVVIGTAIGHGKFVKDDMAATVSAKIAGLTHGEMAKISRIEAKWDYNH